MFAVRLIVLVLLTLYSYGMGMQSVPLNGFGTLVAGSFFVLAPALYLLPTYEAWSRQHVNLAPIALVNLLLGWTLLGWVAALVWALKRAEPVALAEESPAAPLKPTTTCPYCAEEILAAARKCKHCGSEIPTPA